MRRITLSLGASFLSLLLLTSSGLGQIQFSAYMTGADAVPPSLSLATGEAQLALNPATRTLTYRVVTTCVAPATCFTLSLHQGVPGSNGPVILTLNTIQGYFPSTPDLYEGTSPALNDQQIESMLLGATYLSIASGSCGLPLVDVMRGQVQPSIARRFVASLGGAGAIPPTASTATGDAWLTFNEAERSLAYDIDIAGTTASSVELWQGAPGASGSLVATLGGGPIRFCGRVTGLTPAQVSVIRGGGLHLAVPTAAASTGEIGGPMTEATSYHFTAHLKGASMVPPVTSAATGFVAATLDVATGVLSYQIDVTGLSGTDGQINIGFFNQPAIITGSYPGGPTTWTGSTAPLPGAFLELLFRQGFHVTICSTAHPGGEIRGQLVPNPYRYGFGSNTGGGIARIGHRSDYVQGNTAWTATLSGGQPNTQTYLFIGLANQTFVGQPLPFDLQSGGIGQHRAWLWFDPTPGVFFFPATTDPSGCAAINLAVPSGPAFAGFTAYYQWYVLSGTTPAGFSVSDALRVVIQ